MTRAIALVLGVLVLAPAPAAAAGKVLPYTEVIQEHDQWCWAGVDRSLLLFHGKDVAQCTLAEYTRTHETFSDRNFGTVACCTSWTQGCNDWNYMFGGAGSLSDLLEVFGALTTSATYTALSLTQARAQIDLNRPFVFRWGWDGSTGGHFLVGHGYDHVACTSLKCPTGAACKTDDDCSKLSYMNPWFGEGLKIAAFSWVVRNTGVSTWTHTVTATPPAGPCTGKPDGTACNDANPCTTGDACTAGTCAGKATVCLAGPCHQSAKCDQSTGGCVFVNKADGTLCDDQARCTSGDVCKAGKCAGTAIVCPAPAACQTGGTCDPATGSCTSQPAKDGTACDDGDACTSGDACSGGKCAAQPLVCAPPAPCRKRGVCAPKTGACSWAPLSDGTACDDQDDQTVNDACVAGACQGVPVGADPCTGRPDGFACDDANACTQDDTCASHRCTGTAPPPCPAPAACQEAGACDPASGECTFADQPDGTACDDGNAATSGDRCKAGRCAGTVPVDAGVAGECTGMAGGSSCTGGSCQGGICVPDPVQPKGCGCGASGGGAPLALFGFLLAGLWRRRLPA